MMPGMAHEARGMVLVVMAARFGGFPRRRQGREETGASPRSGRSGGHFTKSAHRGGGSGPQGISGTEEVEFFGLPSMMRSV